MLAIIVITLIASFGCSSENKEEMKRKERNERMLKGYGEQNTTPKPIELAPIKK
jgi:hypothetical protein